MTARQRALAVLGHAAVDTFAGLVSGGRLRILAYHAVPDASMFRAQLEHFAERYRIVTGREVTRSFSSRARLPRKSLWLTFDDGYRTVFTKAQPILDELDVRATAFVCPGLIDTNEPFWWDVALAAAKRGMSAHLDGMTIRSDLLERRLKILPDGTRRSIVTDLRARLVDHDARELQRDQPSVADLHDWLAAGHEVGNHTWDHPCLDRCSPATQIDQVQSAHAWLADTLGVAPDSFAYPNGNWSQATEAELVRSGYRTAVGFDHRLTRMDQPALRLSRLRLDADAPLTRARAVVSGAHPLAMRVRDRLRRGRGQDPRNLPR